MGNLLALHSCPWCNKGVDVAQLRTREYLTLPYIPGQEVTPDYMLEFVRRLEGFLQRIEGRIEALQDQVAALETRLALLE